ncbi:MAG TPA: Gfo/Idh/MocA family oxidoreductase [Planctomycetota bacterium]|nr:Gfo/Idh/MocA family oxidoreductase [Planctomycetota bacterium]
MYTVGVVGLGKIAAMYGKPDDAAPYCHVGGIRHSDRVKLAAVADISEAQTAAFRERWGGCFPDLRYYKSFAEMWTAQPPDIVAVCVRGPHHFEVMMQVIEAGPRAIFLEKPPSCSLEEADTMVAAAKAKGIPTTVSYSRHWCPHVLRLQELVQKEKLIGQVKQVVAHTGGSFLSFASHVTDLICQFAGYCPKAIYARGHAGGQAPDGYEPEPGIDAGIVEFENGVTGIHVGQPGEHGGFYVDVLGESGTVRAGIYTPPFAKTKEGPVDLATLGMPPNASVFKVAYGQIADHLDGGPLPHCTDADWRIVNELGFAGIESVLTGRRIELPNANRTRRIYANG